MGDLVRIRCVGRTFHDENDNAADSDSENRRPDRDDGRDTEYIDGANLLGDFRGGAFVDHEPCEDGKQYGHGRARGGEQSMSEAYDQEALQGPHVIEYPFRRSCGPVLSRFFSGLRDGKLVGIRSKTAGVLAPWTRATAALFKSLIVKLGFLDGWRGFLAAWMAARYDFRKYALLRGEQRP